MKFKNFISFFLFFLVGCAQAQQPADRGLFVSMIDAPQVLESKEEIIRLIDFAKQARIKILFVQIYRANKAWFPSAVSDSRLYEKALKSIAQDPFAFLLQEAHSQGIEVHAWVNLLSLSANADAPILKKYTVDILTRNLQSKRVLADYKIDNQYFLEPSDTRVRADLLILVKEILKRYPSLDGLSFDYIRYPDVEPHYGYSQDNMRRFMQEASVDAIDENSLIWKDWKRRQVTDLVRMLKDQARAINPGIQVSTTGCMPYSRAYHEAFQDWAAWVNEGIVDFVVSMNYSGDPKEYERWNKSLRTKVEDFSKVKLGVGAYKLTHFPDMFKEQLRSCEASGAMCAIFHYGSLRDNTALEEVLFKKPVETP